MKIDISDYDYIMSALGNAIFSGLKPEQIWICVNISHNKEEFDTAVSTMIMINEIVKGDNK
jgi:hypothetical protein